MNIETLIAGFQPISLAEMDAVRLMQRTDTKYLFSRTLLAQVIEGIAGEYRVLEVNGVRCNRYRTLYLDTSERSFYIQHQNGKRNRSKVRFRKYVDSDLCFLEVKRKTNKDETIKQRIVVDDFREELSEEQQEFVLNHAGVEDHLLPRLWNTFKRITFVNNERQERLTMDYDLEFSFGDQRLELHDVVIAELKQERMDRLSPFAEAAKKMKIRPTRLSKYCIGSAMLNKHLKANNFKPKIRTIKKLSNDLVA